MEGKGNLEQDIQKILSEMNLTESEYRRVLQNLRKTNPNRYAPQQIDTSGKETIFGVISDAHMGHQDYRPDVTDHAVKNFKEHGVEFILNAGDTLEGMSGREGHIYELAHIGASAQLDFFEEEFKKFEPWNVYSIEAQNSHGGWFKSKGNMGLEIGPELQRRAPGTYIFIGYDEQDIELGDTGTKIRLRHPGGGTAYAVSYKMQKYIESISGGNKPAMVFQGHFHKANYMFYRNVHCFDSGCLQQQSPFMKKIGSPAHLGYWIVKVKTQKNKGITEVTPKFVPFYD